MSSCAAHVAGMKTLVALLLFAVAPLSAAERTLTITDFDRLRVDGGFTVEVVSGRGTSARISGSPDALEAASVQVQGRTLTIRRSASTWGGNPDRPLTPATVRISVPVLVNAWVSGPATVRIDRMNGMRVGLSVEGAGSLSVANLTADKLDVGILGAGKVLLAGKVAGMTALVRGAAEFDASKLSIADARLTSENAGVSTILAGRTANVTATGSGSVVVLGTPACTVKNAGSGTVSCGASQQP